MNERDVGARVAAQLKERVPGLTRVNLAFADGRPAHDDVALAGRETGAATAASLRGVTAAAAERFGVGGAVGSTIRGADGYVHLRSSGDELVLVVVAQLSADIAAVERETALAAALVRSLTAAS
jgi:predicted regulator of Ras-like GTPase activity (Roadblock/LC7/MglB family)